MPNSALYTILRPLDYADPSDYPALLSAATSHLLSLPHSVAGQQLTYQDPGSGRTSLMLLSHLAVSRCPEAAHLLTLMLELGREYSSTTNQMVLRDEDNWTPLHHFAYDCSDLSLTKMVVLEHPPALVVLSSTGGGGTPLQLAECATSSHDNPEVPAFLDAVTDAYNTLNYVAIEGICGGSSPFLVRELSKQAKTLRASVAICLNRHEAAPSTILVSRETRVVLSILGAFCPDLVRRVLEYVGPYAEPHDAGWMAKEAPRELLELRREVKEREGAYEELVAANNKLVATVETQAATIKTLVENNETQAATIGRLTE